MSSQNIVDQTRRLLITNVGGQLPKKLQGMFGLGVKAFSLQPLVSCNGNARMSHAGSRVAAEQQMYRLLHHPKLFLLVWRGVAKQLHLKSKDLVNVDYSNLGPLAILAFGVQTKQGRALPVLMRALASNTQGQKKSHPKYGKLQDYYKQWKKQVQADQFSFVIKSLRLLKYIHGTQPRLVLDRGFVNRGLVQFLVADGWIFYQRMRRDYYVEYNGESTPVNQFRHGEYRVKWAGQPLRLVVGKTRKRLPEPWYILTNDTATNPARILKFYYHRFEIEESFRDLKSLLRLKGSRTRTWQSLRVILCFMSLALLCALSVPPDAIKAIHPKKKLSLVRIWQEALQQALRKPTLTVWGLM